MIPHVICCNCNKIVHVYKFVAHCSEFCTMFFIDDKKHIISYEFDIVIDGLMYKIFSGKKGASIRYPGSLKDDIISGHMIHFPIINNTFQAIPFLKRILKLKAFC